MNTDKTEQGPRNCREAGGHPTCINCANGEYEKCLWVRPAAPPAQPMALEQRLTEIAATLPEMTTLGWNDGGMCEPDEAIKGYTKKQVLEILAKHWADAPSAQPQSEPPLRHCRGCGEGVTTFCRAPRHEGECLVGLPHPGRAATPPAPQEPQNDQADNAARYQYIRDKHWSESDICCVTHPKKNVLLGSFCPHGKLLDEYIDERRKK